MRISAAFLAFVFASASLAMAGCVDPSGKLEPVSRPDYSLGAAWNLTQDGFVVESSHDSLRIRSAEGRVPAVAIHVAERAVLHSAIVTIKAAFDPHRPVEFKAAYILKAGAFEDGIVAGFVGSQELMHFDVAVIPSSTLSFPQSAVCRARADPCDVRGFGIQYTSPVELSTGEWWLQYGIYPNLGDVTVEMSFRLEGEATVRPVADNHCDVVRMTDGSTIAASTAVGGIVIERTVRFHSIGRMYALFAFEDSPASSRSLILPDGEMVTHARLGLEESGAWDGERLYLYDSTGPVEYHVEHSARAGVGVPTIAYCTW